MEYSSSTEVPFTIELFLSTALINFPETDQVTNENKQDTIHKYSTLLRTEKLSYEKTLSFLTQDILVELGIPPQHASAISETAKESNYLVKSVKETQQKLVFNFGFERPSLSKLKQLITIGKPGELYDVVVVHGVRQCGKTHLIRQAFAWLVQSTIALPGQLLFVTVKTNLIEICEFCVERGIKYLALGEIQNINNWEAQLRTIHDAYGHELRIIVCTSDMIKGGWSSSMLGRYFSVEMKPFSFKEFLDLRKFLNVQINSLEQELSMYITFGGFPQVVYNVSNGDLELSVQTLSHIWNSVHTKDVKRVLLKEQQIVDEDDSKTNAVRMILDSGKIYELHNFPANLGTLESAMSIVGILHHVPGPPNAFALYAVDTGILHKISDSDRVLHPFALHTLVFHRLQYLHPGKLIHISETTSFCINDCYCYIVVMEYDSLNLKSMVKLFTDHYISKGKEHASGEYAIIALNKAVYPATTATKFLTECAFNIFDIIKEVAESQTESSLLQGVMEKIQEFAQEERATEVDLVKLINTEL